MINCFLDYIGLAYCSIKSGPYESPLSGKYLNSLPGISIEKMDSVADSEQVTFLGLWTDIQLTAIDQFRDDIIEALKECYEINCDCDYDTLICANLENLSTSWQYLLAHTFFIFVLASDRVNRWTTVDEKKAAELKEFYETKYRSALKKNIKCMDTSDCCLECGGNPEVVVCLP